jgi:hypothetical protein
VRPARAPEINRLARIQSLFLDLSGISAFAVEVQFRRIVSCGSAQQTGSLRAGQFCCSS